MPLCPVCGSEFEGRGKYCSPACKQKQHRATVKASKSAEAVAYLRFCPLVETILRHAVRSGTVAIIAGVNLADLNSLVNHHRFKCWETGTLLHLSHYTSANDRGSLHPENLGVWPGWLNQKLGKRSLNIGHHVSDRDWHNSSFFCSTEDDAYRILQRHFGKQLQSIDRKSVV